MDEAKEARRPATTAAPMGSRPGVFAVRVAVLVVAGGALALALAIAIRHEPAANIEATRRYVCPMHPEVASASPGECPICHMDLESVGGGAAGPHAAAVTTSTFQVYDDVRRRGFGPHPRAPASMDRDGVVSALLYNDEIATLSPDESGVFSPALEPSAPFQVRLSHEPSVPWDRSTARVRFRLDAAARPPPEGTVGWVKLPGKRLVQLTIPYSAILEGADGAYVLVASPDGRVLSKRTVEIGRETGGIAIAVSGLRERERVLTRSAFFVDAERRLRREERVELAP